MITPINHFYDVLLLIYWLVLLSELLILLLQLLLLPWEFVIDHLLVELRRLWIVAVLFSVRDKLFYCLVVVFIGLDRVLVGVTGLRIAFMLEWGCGLGLFLLTGDRKLLFNSVCKVASFLLVFMLDRLHLLIGFLLIAFLGWVLLKRWPWRCDSVVSLIPLRKRDLLSITVDRIHQHLFLHF